MIRKLIYFSRNNGIVQNYVWYIVHNGFDKTRAEKIWELTQGYYNPDSIPAPNAQVLQHFAGQLTQEEVDAFLWIWFFSGPEDADAYYNEFCSAFNYFLFDEWVREDFSRIWREEMRLKRLLEKEIKHITTVVAKAKEIASNLASLIKWLEAKGAENAQIEAERKKQEYRAEIERLGLQEQFQRLLDGADKEILYELDPYDGYFGSLRNATHPEEVFLNWFKSKQRKEEL